MSTTRYLEYPGLLRALASHPGSFVVGNSDLWSAGFVAAGVVWTWLGVLVNTAGRDLEVTWWRERDREVDFVLSGRRGASSPSRLPVAERSRAFPVLPPSPAWSHRPARSSVGAQGLPLEEILSRPASDLLSDRRSILGHVVTDDLLTVEIGDLSVHDVTFPAAIYAIVRWGRQRSGGYVCTPNVDHVAQARHNRSFRDAVNGARLRVPDGMWIVYASRLAGRPLQGTVTGRLLVEQVCAELWRNSERVVFFGAGPDAAQRAIEAVGRRLGVAPIGTGITPEMGLAIDSEADRLHVGRLQDIDPAVIFVGLGAPKQELWMARHAKDLPRATMVGVGAAFDILAGRYREAPRWMTRVGLEWLFRLIQEPRRLSRRYLVDDPWILLWALRTRLRRTG